MKTHEEIAIVFERAADSLRKLAAVFDRMGSATEPDDPSKSVGASLMDGTPKPAGTSTPPP